MKGNTNCDKSTEWTTVFGHTHKKDWIIVTTYC